MPGELLELSLDTLSKIDGGRIAEAFAKALRNCESDCRDRPALKEARKIAVHLTIEPVAGDDGALESCRVQFQVVDSQPRRRSKTYDMRAHAGRLLWNELSPDDVRQRTLDQVSLKAVPNAS